ncbi:hypothetical protein DMENIID0001_153760 [Sergentomyia squamirostris]
MAKSFYLLISLLAFGVVSATHAKHNHQHSGGKKNLESSQHSQDVDIHALTSVSEEIEGISHREKSMAKKGSDTKEKSSKSHAEKGGKTKKEFDEDYESGHHTDAHEGSIKAHYHNKKADKNGKSEKGFRNAFRKREYHKVNKFFGDEHSGGGYNKFGADHAKKNSQTISKDAGKKSHKGSVESSSKKP